MSNIETAAEFDRILSKLTLRERISYISQRFEKVIFGSSFAANDQLLTWAITTESASIELFEREGARSFGAKSIRDVTRDRYALKIATAAAFDRAKATVDAIICSDGKSDDQAQFAIWDAQLKVFKFNPLADYSDDEIIDAIFAHEIPINFPMNSAAMANEDKLGGASQLSHIIPASYAMQPTHLNS